MSAITVCPQCHNRLEVRVVKRDGTSEIRRCRCVPVASDLSGPELCRLWGMVVEDDPTVRTVPTQDELDDRGEGVWDWAAEVPEWKRDGQSSSHALGLALVGMGLIAGGALIAAAVVFLPGWALVTIGGCTVASLIMVAVKAR